jgi:hypothetical protein
MLIASGSTFNNAAGATLTADIVGPGEKEVGGLGSIENQGTFITTGAARFYASAPMNNDGVVLVQQGPLRLDGTGIHTGTFAISAAGQLELAGAQTFRPMC